MVFQFNSRSNSKSDSQSALDFLQSIHRINKIEELETVIKKAASHNAEKVIIRDKGNLALKIGQNIIAGLPVSVSLVPGKEKVYTIKFR